MGDLLAFLNDNSGAFSVLFALVVAAATVFYAILTRQLVGETVRMRAAQTDPHVAVRIEPSDVWINLVMLIVENVGAGPAYDVKLSATPDFKTANKQQLSELGMFKHGLPYMAPAQRVSHFLADMSNAGDKLENLDESYGFTVTASYANAIGTRQEYKYPVNFRQLIGLHSIGEPPLREIVNEIKKVAKALSILESGWKKVQVDVYTGRDRAEQHKAAMERRGKDAQQATETNDDAWPTKHEMLSNDISREGAPAPESAAE